MRKISGITFHLYHYAGNNPVKYNDPDGMFVVDVSNLKQDSGGETPLGNGEDTIARSGCVLTAYVRMAQALGWGGNLEQANKFAKENNLYTKENLLTSENGAKLVNGLIKTVNPSATVTYEGSKTGTVTDMAIGINGKENSEQSYFVTGRIKTSSKDGTEFYEHTLSINSNSVFAVDISNINNSLGFNYNDTSSANRSGTNDYNRVNEPIRIDFFSIRHQSAKEFLNENQY